MDAGADIIALPMEGAEQTLVVILSGTLALFLVLGIVATIKLIQVLNHLKSITEKAEHIATTAENIGEMFRYTAGPAAIGRLLSNIAESVFKRHNDKRGKNG